jgi:hypothetical protein
MGRDSVENIATRYVLDSPGIESRWRARFSAPVQTGPAAHPASYTMGTVSFPGLKKSGNGIGNPSHQVLSLKKEHSCTSSPPLDLRGLF